MLMTSTGARQAIYTLLFLLTRGCCLSDVFSLSLYQLCKKRGLSKSYQHLPAGQIYSLSV